jgi:hypothetical protein
MRSDMWWCLCSVVVICISTLHILVTTHNATLQSIKNTGALPPQLKTTSLDHRVVIINALKVPTSPVRWHRKGNFTTQKNINRNSSNSEHFLFIVLGDAIQTVRDAKQKSVFFRKCHLGFNPRGVKEECTIRVQPVSSNHLKNHLFSYCL